MKYAAVTPGQAWGIGKTVSEISPRVIIDEAARSVVLAVVGEEASADWLLDALLTDAASPAERAAASASFKRMDAPPDFDAAGFYVFTVYVEGPGAPIGVRGKNSVPFVGTLDEAMLWMLRSRPDLSIALSRAFRRFRIPACELLIQRTARANAQIAFFSALPKLIPIPLPFLPISSLADVILLTKNQAMLVMRLAAAFGHRPGYNRQVKELLGIVAAALGWRTLARELADFVPLGIGAALKAGIAFSGTVAVGRAALFFYTTGNKPTPEQIRAFEKDAHRAAQEVAEAIADEAPPAPNPPAP